MSLKRKIFNIFAAVVMVFGSVPMSFLTAHADQPTGAAPVSSKTVTSKGDGTYDITIEIQGKSSTEPTATEADVVLVYDVSSSMRTDPVYDPTTAQDGAYGYYQGAYSESTNDGNYVRLYRRTNSGGYQSINTSTYNGTVYVRTGGNSYEVYTGTRFVRDTSTRRYEHAEPALQSLESSLSAYSNVTIHRIAFGAGAREVTQFNYGTYNDLATEWDEALELANSIGNVAGHNKIVIFISDGNPRAANNGSNNEALNIPVYNGAVTAAQQIVSGGADFYGIGAFGDVYKMQSLVEASGSPASHYYSANNGAQLQAALDEILAAIVHLLTVADLQITDGITAATSMPVNGTAGAFKYSVPASWGEPGVGFNEATFDGSSVHWNPGYDNTLSNGQSASITFTVWPSQEAMDCIAAIKNSSTCDKNLDEFGLELVDGNYYLKTNSSASFTYRTANRVEGSTEVTYSDPSNPVTIVPEREIPPLPESLLSVTKVWADSMDPKQRDDISKVTLDFYVDDVKVNTYEFTGNKEGSEWINANGTTDGYSYAIAPGVMKKLAGLSDAEAATLRAISNEVFGGTVTVDGVEYAVLEKGHTYRFEEFYTLVRPESTNHYKITKKIYHPMIVDDGSIHDVEFSEDKKAAVIDSETLTKLSAENTLNGGIRVYKKVINNDVEDTTVNDDYTITVTISEDGGIYKIFHADETNSGDIAFQGNSFTVTIKQSDIIQVKDLLDGTTFSVTEVLPDGYDKNKIEYELIDYNNPSEEPLTGSAAQIVHGNMSSTATVTNYLSSGDLIISKEVVVDSGNKTQAEGQEFSFTVKFYEKQGDTNPVRVDTETCKAVKHKDTCTIENIPKGWYYEITEAAKAGFNNGAATVRTGTIKQGDNKEDFVNTYAVTPLTETVFAKKAFTNRVFWLPSDNFTFQLKYNNAVKDSKTVKLGNDETETATFNVTITDEGEYRYTITELETDENGNSVFRDGVSRVEDDDDVVAKIVVEDKGDGTLVVKEKSYLKEDQTIYNQFKGTKTYGANKELEFEKVLEGRDWESTDEFTFTISSTDEDAPLPEDTSLTVKKNTTGHKVNFGTISFTEADVNQVYHYTVSESFDTSKIQSVVPAEEVAEGISFTIEVEYTEDGKLSLKVSDYENTFTNIYETTNLTAKKIWADDSDRDGKRADYDFYVAVKDGDNFVAYEPIDVSGEEDEESFTFEDLPLLRGEKEIEYTIVEATGCATSDSGVITCEKEFENNESDGVYSVSYSNGNTITNAHTPETKTITIKKTWNVPESGLPSTQPAFILVDLTNDENNEKKVVRLEGNDYGEWTSAPITVLAYKNHGEDITYEVKETGIDGENNLTGDNKDTLYIYNGEILEGKWVAESVEDSFEVKNTWTAATNVYEGSTKFYIKKVDDKDRAMSDVKFTVDGKEYTTNAKGIIEIKVAEDTETAEDDLTFAIKETETQEGYDLVSGTENLNVTSTSSFDRADVDEMKNYYTKTYSFDPTEIDGYVWNDNMYIVTNNRSKANSLKIEKTFSGVSKNALKDLTFTVTGPNDFGDEGEMTINFEDCDISGNKATCEVDADIFTGNYTVVENNAEVKYFDLTTSGDNNATKKVSSGSDVVFKITNKYVAKTTSYTITKVWDDNHDQDGKRPGSLTVNLKADGKTVKTEQLSDNYEGDEENIWTITWDNLPIANEDGDVIGYLGEEELKSDDYDLTNTEEGENSITFTNTHEPELINKTGEIKVTKIWEDGNNKLGVRPGSIYVVLLADGEEFDAATFGENKDGEWVFIFEDLYKYSEGHEIEYSVEEGKLSNDYSTKIEGNATDGFVITNRSTNPCAFGGCGGTTPNTGHFTSENGSATEEGSIITLMVGAITTIVLSFGILVGNRRKAHRLTK